MLHITTPLPFNGNKKAEAVLFESLRCTSSAALAIYFTRDGMGLMNGDSNPFAHPTALCARDAAFFAYCCEYMKVASSSSLDLNHDTVANRLLSNKLPKYLIDEVSVAMERTFDVLDLDGPAAVSSLLKRRFGEFMIGETELNYSAWRKGGTDAHNSFLYELLFVNIIDALPPAVKSSPRILGAADALHVTTNIEAGLHHLREQLFPQHMHGSIPKNSVFSLPDSHVAKEQASARAEYALFREGIVSRYTFTPPADLVAALAERIAQPRPANLAAKGSAS